MTPEERAAGMTTADVSPNWPSDPVPSPLTGVDVFAVGWAVFMASIALVVLGGVLWRLLL